VKAGVRAVGIAESYREPQPRDAEDHRGRSESATSSTLAAVVLRANRAVETVAFETCTVGGLDATSAVESLLERVDRPDARYVFVAGVALAWYNVLDLDAIASSADRPVLAVSFEESTGLESALGEAFDGDALDARLDRYRALPPRRSVSVGDDTVFVRSLNVADEHADEVVREFTFEGGRPEPVRVAREVARGGDALHDTTRKRRDGAE
jgi:endonuclease V-like protein UPF0215 family